MTKNLATRLNAASLVLPVAVALFAGACGTTSPTPLGYAGQWSGTTAQGQPIAFTISTDEKVTSITVGHNFSGCSGSQTFSNLSLDIAPQVTCIPGPCPGSLSSYRAFGYSAGSADGPMTTVNGLFPSMTNAEGAVGFRDYPGCGTTLGVGWSATKR